MLIKQEYKKIINTIIETGVQVIYFPETEEYYIVESFSPSNTNLGVDYHELKGYDITLLIENFDSNFQTKTTLETKILSLKPEKFKIHKDYKYKWFF